MRYDGIATDFLETFYVLSNLENADLLPCNIWLPWWNTPCVESNQYLAVMFLEEAIEDPKTEHLWVLLWIFIADLRTWGRSIPQKRQSNNSSNGSTRDRIWWMAPGSKETVSRTSSEKELMVSWSLVKELSLSSVKDCEVWEANCKERVRGWNADCDCDIH